MHLAGHEVRQARVALLHAYSCRAAGQVAPAAFEPHLRSLADQVAAMWEAGQLSEGERVLLWEGERRQGMGGREVTGAGAALHFGCVASKRTRACMATSGRARGAAQHTQQRLHHVDARACVVRDGGPQGSWRRRRA